MIGRSIVVPLLGVILLLIIGCGDAASRSGNRNMANSAKPDDIKVSTDASELAKKIGLPVQPVDVRWTEKRLGSDSGTVPGPTDHVLIAQFQFDEAGKKKLLSPASESNQRATIEAETWFADELRGKAVDRNGYKLIEGQKLDGAAFLKSPYSNATLIYIPDTDFFILKLSTF